MRYNAQYLTLRYAITCTVHRKTLKLHEHNNRLSYDLLIAYYYVSTLTNTKQDSTHPIRHNFTSCGCSLTSWPGYMYDSSHLYTYQNATAQYRE